MKRRLKLGFVMNKIATLRTFKLYLLDKTIELHDVKVIRKDDSVHLICNPLIIKLQRWKGLGICAFDAQGIIGCVQKLPKFMFKMLNKQESNKRCKLSSTKLRIADNGTNNRA